MYFALLGLCMSCSPTKIVVPLQEGQVQIGATLGGLKVDSGSIPLMGIYAAKVFQILLQPMAQLN